MTLLFIDHTFQYEIERLFRAFFPPIKIQLSNDITLAEGDYCLTQRIREDNAVRLLMRLCAEGRALEQSETVGSDTPKRSRSG